MAETDKTKLELILAEWQHYYRAVYPRGLSREALASLEGAFYAGAAAALTLLYRGMKEDDFRRLETLRDELKGHFDFPL